MDLKMKAKPMFTKRMSRYRSKESLEDIRHVEKIMGSNLNFKKVNFYFYFLRFWNLEGKRK